MTAQPSIVRLAALEDVDVAGVVDGMALVYDAASGKFKTSRGHRVYNVLDYGAVGDGSHDDWDGIMAAITAANADAAAIGGVSTVFFPNTPNAYGITKTLNLDDVEYVTLLGETTIRELFVYPFGSSGVQIAWNGVTADPMVRWQAVTKTDGLHACAIRDILFDCAIVGDGLVLGDHRGGYFDCQVSNPVGVGVDCVAAVGGLGFQANRVRCAILCLGDGGSSAIGMRWSSTSAGNVSRNEFDIDIYHDAGVGLDCGNSDSNEVTHRFTRTGAAAVDILLRGSQTLGVGFARNNRFHGPAPTVTSQATGFAQPAQENLFDVTTADFEPHSPQPTIEPGSTLVWRDDQGNQQRTRSDPRSYLNLHDDFMVGSPADGAVGELRWSVPAGTISRPAATAGRPGFFNLATGTVQGTIAAMCLGAAGSALFLPAEAFDLLFLLRLNTADTNTSIRVGLADAPGSDPPANGLYMEKLAAQGLWWYVGRANGVQTRGSTGLAPDTNWHRFRMRRWNDTEVVFTTDDTVYPFTSIPIPAVGLQPFLQIINPNNGVNKHLDVDVFDLRIGSLAR